MSKKYEINITNGIGEANVFNGTYTVESNTVGYNNLSINPSELNVVEGTNTYELKISADGTFTLHVTETGAQDGTPIVGAKFIRCDSSGTTYGDEIVTNETGTAVFSNVPYDTSTAPIIYYKQTESDGSHTFDNNLKNITLETSSKTLEIENPKPVLRTFKLTDANYNNLPITSGIISLNQ